jgi:hypothetical protein
MTEMTEKVWKNRIKKDCVALGTYKPEFETVIDSLSRIMAQRDATFEQFVKEGSQILVIKTFDRGAQNPIKNPLLGVWKEFNDQAIVYLRELGLSPKGYKAITDEAMKNQKTDALAQALKELS